MINLKVNSPGRLHENDNTQEKLQRHIWRYATCICAQTAPRGGESRFDLPCCTLLARRRRGEDLQGIHPEAQICVWSVSEMEWKLHVPCVRRHEKEPCVSSAAK
jgi:hypothetical protein